MVSGLPARPMAAMRPARMPMAVLRTPSSGSSTSALRITASQASRVARTESPSRAVLPKPGSTSLPQRVVGLDLDHQRGVAEAHARGRARTCGRRRPGRAGSSRVPVAAGMRARRSAVSRAPGASSGPSTRPAKPIATRSPAMGTRSTSRRSTRKRQAHRGARREVEPPPVGRRAVEAQARVGLEEVEGERDADRHLGLVDDVHAHAVGARRRVGHGPPSPRPPGAFGATERPADGVVDQLDEPEAVAEQRLHRDVPQHDHGNAGQHVVGPQHGLAVGLDGPASGSGRRAPPRRPCRRRSRPPLPVQAAARGRAGRGRARRPGRGAAGRAPSGSAARSLPAARRRRGGAAWRRRRPGAAAVPSRRSRPRSRRTAARPASRRRAGRGR